MAKYKPGTLDDYAVLRRRQRRTAALANEANIPTGSQVAGTTEKVAAVEAVVKDIDEKQIIPEEIRFSSSNSPPEGFSLIFAWNSPGGVIYAFKRNEDV